jgi:hypothetical protein
LVKRFLNEHEPLSVLSCLRGDAQVFFDASTQQLRDGSRGDAEIFRDCTIFSGTGLRQMSLIAVGSGIVKQMSSKMDDTSGESRQAIREQIDENLKRVYSAALNEELPDRFRELLAQLKARGTTGGGNQQ